MSRAAAPPSWAGPACRALWRCGEECCLEPVQIMIIPPPAAPWRPRNPSLQPKVLDAMISDARATPVCSISQHLLALGEAFESNQRVRESLVGPTRTLTVHRSLRNESCTDHVEQSGLRDRLPVAHQPFALTQPLRSDRGREEDRLSRQRRAPLRRALRSQIVGRWIGGLSAYVRYRTDLQT